MRRLFLTLVCLLAASTLIAQERLTDEAIRPLVAEAIKAGAGNPDKVIDALDRAVKAKWGDFDKGAVMLVSYAAFSSTGAIAMPPYLTFRSELKTKLRQFEPIEDLKLAGDDVLVEILPQTFDAMDIIKVVVLRDGQMVDPTRGALAPREFSNRLGAKTMLHAGTLVFPASAFGRGGKVEITLVPESGKNITTTLTDRQLAKFR